MAVGTVHVTDLGDMKKMGQYFSNREKVSYLQYSSVKLKFNRKTTSSV